MLRKIVIQNYRGLRDFSAEFDEKLNVLVGDNGVGKSTLLEAIHLGLTGRIGDLPFSAALCPHFINREAAAEYLNTIKKKKTAPLPEIIIDLFLDSSNPDLSRLRGSNNALHEDAPGLRVRAAYNPEHTLEYNELINSGALLHDVPTEYYHCEWRTFAGQSITSRSIPIACILLDATQLRLDSAAGYQVRRLVREQLDAAERAAVGLEYRRIHTEFISLGALKRINDHFKTAKFGLPESDLAFALDPTARGGWESALTPHLGGLPIRFVGKGIQSVLKTLLALDRRTDTSAKTVKKDDGEKERRARIVLLEEPENHLAPGLLQQMVNTIVERCSGAQCFATTHSSFVINKLGLEHLRLMGPSEASPLGALPPDTLSYFKRLPGYNTLRAVLCKRSILVEGPSDELIVQRAYFDLHGALPLAHGVEVISVGKSHKRFLDLMQSQGRRVDIVVDNDRKERAYHENRFKDYIDGRSIHLRVGRVADGRTLEPQLISSAGRTVLNHVFSTNFEDDEKLEEYMTENKTECALNILEHKEAINVPEYIREAVKQ